MTSILQPVYKIITINLPLSTVFRVSKDVYIMNESVNSVNKLKVNV